MTQDRNAAEIAAEAYELECECEHMCGCAEAFLAGVAWRDERVKKLEAVAEAATYVLQNWRVDASMQGYFMLSDSLAELCELKETKGGEV